MSDTVIGRDGRPRCMWAAVEPETQYHDTEWGRPGTGDISLFERVSLEGFQAGLSWRTILTKRDNFRAAFDAFDVATVARYTDRDVERLLGNASIIRHRGKIQAVINNAQRAIELIDAAGSLDAYFWSFRPEREHIPGSATYTAESTALSTALKKKGWKFVGPTTMFALMQAEGIVNDHALGCIVREEVEQARTARIVDNPTL